MIFHSKQPADKKCFLRAGFTVELALLFPMILLVILSVLCIDAQVMNRNYFRCLSCEQSISGRDSGAIRLFAAKDTVRNEEDSDKERTVSFRSGTKGIWRIFDFNTDTSSTYKKLQPESFIRKTRSLGEALSNNR